MWLLQIYRARCENINARAHRRHPEELEVKLAASSAFASLIVDVKEVSHRE